MTQPENGPATRAAVKTLLKITDATDDQALDDVVAAVNDVVRGLPVSQLLTPDIEEEWPARVVRGADMLAARLWRRRNTPSGVEAFGDSGPIYVTRNDPDVAMLLQLGAYAKPAVG